MNIENLSAGFFAEARRLLPTVEQLRLAAREAEARETERRAKAARRVELSMLEAEIETALATSAWDADVETIAQMQGRLAAVKFLRERIPEKMSVARSEDSSAQRLAQLIELMEGRQRKIPGEIPYLENEIAKPFNPNLNPRNFTTAQGAVDTFRMNEASRAAMAQHYDPLKQQLENLRTEQSEIERFLADYAEIRRLAAEPELAALENEKE